MIKAYAAFEPNGELQPFEYDPGSLGPDEIEINVESCGICHSDLSMLENAWGITTYPFVPGHEVIGIVGEVGNAVTHLSKGQRVGLGWHASYCMTCDTCMSGDHNLCVNAVGTVVNHHGGFADKVRASAASVTELPSTLDPKISGPLFCAGITVFNPLIQFNIKPTDKVGVIGIGGLGHLALQFLNAWGCDVTAFTSSKSKAEEAKQMGAHQTLDSRDPVALDGAKCQFDMIISTVNVPLDWPGYLSTLKPKGRLHLLGVTVDPIELNVAPMLFSQISVSSSPVGSPATIRKMIAFAARHDIKTKVEHYRFDQANEAIARLRTGDARYRIVLSN